MIRCVILCSMSILLFGQITTHKLQYIDVYDREQTSYAEWCAGRPLEASAIGKTYRSAVDGHRQSLVNVVVYAPLYVDIYDSLSMYVTDLESEGYTVQVDTVRGWDAQALRSHLAALLGSELVGAVLVGNVPFAWYEEESSEGREEYPIDLYLMDLDGQWIDSDNNGLYDNHSGDRAPEIWVGRIYASSMTWGNEIYLLNNYFSKLHRYRTGGYSIPQKALAYVDDDWYSFNRCGLDELYDTVVVVRNYNTTTANDFRSRWNDPYEWVQICSHSSPWGNTFKYSGGYAGTTFNFEMWFANPPFLFTNLFQCSGTRFFEENYCGGCYIFGPYNGLLTIGSAKVGSMLHFDDFYGPLNTGLSIGEAFKEWFIQWGISDPSWFYGMCICGDPLLEPKQSSLPYAQRHRHDMPFISELQWSDPEPVNLDDETDGYVSATTDGAGRIWAAWVTGRSNSYGRTEICAAYRSGGTWSSAVIVDPFEYWDFFPSMTCDSAGTALLSWSRCYGRNYDVFLSSYNGSSWVSPYRVSSRATDALHPAMTFDGDGRLWVVMERWNHLNGDIYCRYYQTGWQSMFAVTVGSANDYKPAIATDSTGMAWCVWASERYEENRNIYVKNYNAGTGHWENLYRLTSNPSQDQDVSICVDGNGDIWVAWTTWRNGNSDIYSCRYIDGVWSQPSAVTSDQGNDEHCVLAVDQDGCVWCIWQSDRTGDWEILGRYYQDAHWQDISNISASDASRDILPAVTLDDSGNVWVLFQTDRNGNWDIYASSIFSDLVLPSVTVLVPDGGEVWNIGDTDTIWWSATDNNQIDSITIMYSTNNGANWMEIATGEPNDSSYVWEVPATPSTQCYVLVTAYDGVGNAGIDISNQVFTIRDAIAPQVTVYSPNGGEVYYAGDTDTIRWIASDNIGVDSVAIEFSPDNGANWSFVAGPLPDDTLYEWQLPGVHSTECLVRVRAFDAGDNMGEDMSDSVFSILDNTPPEVTVIVPNGGEVWYWGELQTIEWTSIDNVGVDSLDIHLSLDGGATYPVLITHFNANDSLYDWTIPESVSSECLMRVTCYDVAGLMTIDESDSLFTIGEYGIEEFLNRPQQFSARILNSNPFINDLMIKLAIPSPMVVSVIAYDIEGRMVADLVDGVMQQGYHIVTWDSQRLPAGVYFVRITTDEEEITEKVIKLR
jgi:hypothetical protein